MNPQNIPRRDSDARRDSDVRRLFPSQDLPALRNADLSDIEHRLLLHLLDELEARERDRRVEAIMADIRWRAWTDPVIGYVLYAALVAILGIVTWGIVIIFFD